MEKDKIWPLIGASLPLHPNGIKSTMEMNYEVTDAFIDESGMQIKNVFQFFNGDPEAFSRRPLTNEEAGQIVKFMSVTGSKAFCHCPFKINLAKDPKEAPASLRALADDVTNVSKAGISAVCHIGSGLKKFNVESVCKTLAYLDFHKVNDHFHPLLLENSAGDGTALGVSFEELEFLAQNTDPHVGFCIDTQHSFPGLKETFASEDEVNEFFKRLDRSVGLHRVKVFHLNDSKWNPETKKGKKDRHAPFFQNGAIWGNDTKKQNGLRHLLLRGGELGIPFLTETLPVDPYLIYSFLNKPKL